MKRIILSLFALVVCLCSEAQVMGTVKGSQSLQEGPSTEAQSFGMLPEGCQVQVFEAKDGWTKVGFDSVDETGKAALLLGYLPTETIVIDSTTIAKDFTNLPRVKVPATSSEVSTLGKEVVTPKAEKKSTCSLRINAKDASYDAIVKLCSVANDECVRMVYMKRGTSFNINNIPYGEYYVKTISGDDLCDLNEPADGWNIAFAKDEVANKSQQTFNFKKDKKDLHFSSTHSWEFVIQKR